MKLTGTATLHAPASQVWAALTDPDVLARSIPGCQRLEPAGPDSYRFTVTAGVASIRGTYTGEVALAQQHEPTSLVLTARGAATTGPAFVRGALAGAAVTLAGVAIRGLIGRRSR
jgi:carbon monoxide dehydrogenase subunit G